MGSSPDGSMAWVFTPEGERERERAIHVGHRHQQAGLVAPLAKMKGLVKGTQATAAASGSKM